MDVTANRRWSLAIAIALWTAVATAVALLRVPYDDEWFSLQLALEVAPDSHWPLIVGDPHPPWVNLFDRALAQLWPSRVALLIPRLAASCAAVVLLARMWQHLTGRAAQWLVLAALHPIVLTYAGAVRWYPFLLLAHALRAWALWGPARDTTKGRAVFVGGALLGSLAGYVDLPFVIHDASWLALHSRPEWRAQRARLWTLGAALALVAATFVFSPLGLGHPLSVVGRALRSDLWRPLAWAGLGVAGEAHPPWPWLLLAPLVPIAQIRGLWLLRQGNAAARWFWGWLWGYGLLWLFSTLIGCIWHPRYSLLLWLALTANIALLLWTRRRIDRVLAAAAALYLVVGTGFTTAGRGFFRADLNALRGADCRVMADGHDLVITSYARLSMQLVRTCDPQAEVLTVPSYLPAPTVHDMRVRLREAIAGHTKVALVRRQWASGDIPFRHRLAVEVLATHCIKQTEASAMRLPHARLRQLVVAERPVTLYVRETWRCPGNRTDRYGQRSSSASNSANSSE